MGSLPVGQQDWRAGLPRQAGQSVMVGWQIAVTSTSCYNDPIGSGDCQSAQAFKATYSILDETKTVRGLAAFILEQFLD